MNVCLVSQDFPPETAWGGIGTQTWNKARTLAHLGHTVHVLSCAAIPGPNLRTESDAGVTVHRMRPPMFETEVDDLSTVWLGYSWSLLRPLQYLMQMTDFDVIDFPDYGAEGFAYQLSRTSRNWVPVVVQLHGPLAMFAERTGWPDKHSKLCRVGTFMEETSIKQADGLMACSVNIADFTADFYAVPRESIDVVYSGVDSETFRPYDRERFEGRPTVLFVGNIAANKGVVTVFEAVLRLRPKYPNILLQILGKADNDADKDLLQELRQRARGEGAEANAEFLGFIDRGRLPEFYRRASVFCSPAHHEPGVANVYIEAMACGCPVIASISGAAPEGVADGRTGLLVPPNDVEATAAALDRILGDASLRRQMGEAGRRRVEDSFAMDKYILRVLETYRRAIGRSRQKLNQLKAEQNAEARKGAKVRLLTDLPEQHR